jgi:hypothetical protein
MTEEEKNKLTTKNFRDVYVLMLADIGKALREADVTLPPHVILEISKAFDKAIEAILIPQSTH